MIKNPGGEVAVWSVLWILFGSLLCYTSFQVGDTGMGVIFGMVAVAWVLLWLDMRQAKWLIIAYCAFATFGGILALLARGIELRIASQLFGVIYTMVLLLRWDGGPDAD